MPPLRPPIHLSKPTALLLSNPARHLPPPPPPPRPSAARMLASTHPPDVIEQASSDTASHESPYDPPSGWLFGIPPGEKYKKEGWENLWVYGYWGSLVLGIVAYAYKPDTSIQTWALEEARRRLEAEGILPDPDDEAKK